MATVNPKGTRKPKWEHRKIKRKKAQKQKEAREKRSASQQLKLLDKKLGKGVGAVKERARLEPFAAKEKPKKKVVRKTTKRQPKRK